MKLVKIGARLVRHALRLMFQMAEVAVPGGSSQECWNALAGCASLPPENRTRLLDEGDPWWGEGWSVRCRTRPASGPRFGQ